MPLMVGAPITTGNNTEYVPPKTKKTPRSSPLTAALPFTALVVAIAFLFVGTYSPFQAHASLVGPYYVFYPGLIVSLLVGLYAFVLSLMRPRSLSGVILALLALILTIYQMLIPLISPTVMWME
jgi:hypothetical protein